MKFFYLSVMLCIITHFSYGQCAPPAPNGTDQSNSCSQPSFVTLQAQSTNTACGTMTHKWYTTATGNTYVGGGTYISVGTCAVYTTKFDVYIPAGTTKSYWISAVLNGCEGPRKQLTATMLANNTPTLSVTPTLAMDGPRYVGAVFCALDGTATPTLTASGGSSGSTYQWYAASSGGSPLYTGAAYTPVINYSQTTNGLKTFYLGGTLKNTLGCSFPINTRHAVSVKLLNYASLAPNSAGPDREFFSTDATISLTPAGNGYSWWSSSPGVTASTFNPSIAGIGARNVRLTYTNTYPDAYTNCSPPPDEAVYTVYGGPILVITGPPTVPKGGSTTLMVQGDTYSSHTWTGPDGPLPGATGHTIIANKAGVYSVTVTKGSLSKTVSKTVGSGIESQTGMNFRVAYAPQKSGYNSTTVFASAPIEDVQEQVEYFDGLGRPVQTVSTQGSPLKKDVVQPVVYDAYGREAREYLPVVMPDQTNGWYKPVLFDGQGNYAGTVANFYNNPVDKIADDIAPYSEQLFERSPLNRIIKQGSPGTTWQPSPAASSYANSSQNWYYSDFLATGASGGGGSITVSISNNILTANFSAGFGSAVLRTGPVKLITSNPTLYDMDLGLFAMGNYRASIREGWLTFEATGSTAVAVTGFGMASPGASLTYTKNLLQTDYVIKTEYKLNGANEVLAWTFLRSSRLAEAGTVGSLSYVPVNKLKVKKTLDEKNQVRLEYFDNDDKLILKRIQAGASSSPVDDINYASTYYIYDDARNLSCIIPPQASALLATQYFHGAATAATKEAFLSRWSFRYAYDDLGRTIRKQVPGAKPVYLVYDSRDRLVLAQDGNQRKSSSGELKKEWIFTKYDAFGRTVITGLYTHPGNDTSQAEMQSYVNAQRIAATSYYEDYNGVAATDGYTNRSFPTANRVVFTVNVYDQYDFITPLVNSGNAGIQTYNYTAGDLTGQDPARFATVKGQLTGTRINILGTGNHLWNVHYYDNQYRLIQKISQHHRGGIDRITNVYDFLRIKETKTTHVSGASYTTKRRFTYDHTGRLKQTWHTFNTEPEVLLSSLEYNELGQVVTKNLHSRNSGSSFTHSNEMLYTIRGWLKKVNDPLVPNPSSLFSLELNYDAPIFTASPSVYNGNISELTWKRIGADQQSYGFEYDAMSRLVSSNYIDNKSSLNNGRYTEKIGDATANPAREAYDLNGNIKNLLRYGKNGAGMFQKIDDLTYTLNANRITRVDDVIPDVPGTQEFKDGAESVGEYLYDQNGNLIVDANRGITSIEYNHLNLPVKVSKSATDYVTYSYNAIGHKLSQQVFGSTPKTTDYIGEFIYENNVLAMVSHEEGRIVPDNAPGAIRPWDYQYFLKDHVGNVRVTFSEKKSIQVHPATLEDNTQSSESLNFRNYSRTGLNLFNHTVQAGATYSQMLNGGVNGRVGLAKSFEVQPGDVIDMEVYAKYEAPSAVGSNINTLLSSLVSAFSLGSGSVITESVQAQNAFNQIFPLGEPWISETEWENEDAPKAYLNYILFNENFEVVDAGFDQVCSCALQAGVSPVVPHDYLSLHVSVEQKGYLYVYLSNENPVEVKVYFDDFKVVHTSSIQQVNDYYPYGTTFQSFRPASMLPNNFQFSGKEVQDELELGWIDFGARMYMPELGRWNAADPLVEYYEGISPYQYGLDNPVNFIDPNGMTTSSIIDYINELFRTAPNGTNATYDKDGKCVCGCPGKPPCKKPTNEEYQQLLKQFDDYKNSREFKERVRHERQTELDLQMVKDWGIDMALILTGEIAVRYIYVGGKWIRTLIRMRPATKTAAHYLKLFKPTSQWDFVKTLYRGTTGSEAGAKTLFLTDDAAVAATYVKNGGQVTQYTVTEFSIKALEASGELVMKTGIHGPTGAVSKEYLFQGKELVEALNSIAKALN